VRTLHLKLPLLLHTTDLIEDLSPSAQATADAVFTIVPTTYTVTTPLNDGGRNNFLSVAKFIKIKYI
jgi:hypothetical protein